MTRDGQRQRWSITSAIVPSWELEWGQDGDRSRAEVGAEASAGIGRMRGPVERTSANSYNLGDVFAVFSVLWRQLGDALCLNERKCLITGMSFQCKAKYICFLRPVDIGHAHSHFAQNSILTVTVLITMFEKNGMIVPVQLAPPSQLLAWK